VIVPPVPTLSVASTLPAVMKASAANLEPTLFITRVIFILICAPFCSDVVQDLTNVTRRRRAPHLHHKVLSI
jgi:hypothetical protein